MLSRTSNGKLFSINEEEQREALKGFYERSVSIEPTNQTNNQIAAKRRSKASKLSEDCDERQ